MKPLLLVLDDWEGLIEKSSSWAQVRDQVDIRFLTSPLDRVADPDLAEVRFMMALRERTALTEQVFSRLPKLKLVLQTGGHAYHIDQDSACKRGIAIALGRRVRAPLASV